jgi:glycosyltransferase involved in cell wall biosynthesis
MGVFRIGSTTKPFGPQYRIVFLKQTAALWDWFTELSADLASSVGPCLTFSSVDEERVIANLTLRAGVPYRRDSDAARVVSWLRYFLQAAWVAARLRGSPLLFIVAQPPFLALLGYVLNRLRGWSYVIWVDDVFPDGLIRLGRLSPNGFPARLWRRFNRLTYSRAARVFTLGDCMASTIGPYLDANPAGRRALTVVSTWVDAERFHPIPKAENPFAREHGEVDKFTVLYSGNLGESHDLSVVLDAAASPDLPSDVSFLIISNSPRAHEIAAQATTRGLKNVHLLPLQPAGVLPYSLATADVALVALRHGIEGISMPSKTYYNMAAGAAVLGISRSPSDLAGLLHDCHCGINIEPGDSAGFLNALLRFYHDRVYLQRCRESARAAANGRFSRKVNTGRVLNELEPLLPQRLPTTDRPHQGLGL